MNEIGGWTRLWLVLSLLAGWVIWMSATPKQFVTRSGEAASIYARDEARRLARAAQCDDEFRYTSFATGRKMNLVPRVAANGAPPIPIPPPDFADGTYKVHRVTIDCYRSINWPVDWWLPFAPALLMLVFGLTTRWIILGFFGRR